MARIGSGGVPGTDPHLLLLSFRVISANLALLSVPLDPNRQGADVRVDFAEHFVARTGPGPILGLDWLYPESHPLRIETGTAAPRNELEK